MARSKNTRKYGLNENTMHRVFANEDFETIDHATIKSAYCRARKYGFSKNDALADWFEYEAEMDRTENPLSS
jgi:hypothetical protein